MRKSTHDTNGRPRRGPYSEMGRRILDASKRVLAEGGIEALTISAIAAKAGVYGSAIHYHFGSKEGLKTVLVEQLLNDERLRAELAIDSLPPGRARLREAMRRFSMIGGRETQLAGFETLGTQLRDAELARRVRERYVLGRELFVKVLSDEADPELAAALEPVAQVIHAFLDGMNVQLLIDPGTDEAAALAMMEEMAVAKIKELAPAQRARAGLGPS